MRFKIKSLLVLICIYLLCAAETVEFAQSKPSPDSDTLAVRKAVENFIEAFNNLEWERFSKCFSTDATVFNPAIPEVPDQRRADGKGRVEAIFKLVFEAARKQKSAPPYLNIQPKDIKIQMLRDVAVVTFHFDRGKTSFGRRTLVFQRQADKWLIVHVHASNVEMK